MYVLQLCHAWSHGRLDEQWHTPLLPRLRLKCCQCTCQHLYASASKQVLCATVRLSNKHRACARSVLLAVCDLRQCSGKAQLDCGLVQLMPTNGASTMTSTGAWHACAVLHVYHTNYHSCMTQPALQLSCDKQTRCRCMECGALQVHHIHYHSSVPQSGSGLVQLVLHYWCIES